MPKFSKLFLVDFLHPTTSMAPKKRTKTIHEVGTPSKAPQLATRATQTSRASARGNAPHSLGLVNPSHIDCFNCLNSRSAIATRYYDK